VCRRQTDEALKVDIYLSGESRIKERRVRNLAIERLCECVSGRDFTELDHNSITVRERNQGGSEASTLCRGLEKIRQLVHRGAMNLTLMDDMRNLLYAFFDYDDSI